MAFFTRTAKVETEPQADKQMVSPVAKPAPAQSDKRIEVSSVASVLVQDGAAIVVADGKQETVKCSKAEIVFKG